MHAENEEERGEKGQHQPPMDYDLRARERAARVRYKKGAKALLAASAQIDRRREVSAAQHTITMASSSWLAFLLPVLCLLGTTASVDAARAFFVFGDSLVDNGNNNFLITAARADSPPYGIDTPDHRATGRFSNGKNVPDIISKCRSRCSLHVTLHYYCG
jgi:hypothetical protein